jgi:hypothetical protein
MLESLEISRFWRNSTSSSKFPIVPKVCVGMHNFLISRIKKNTVENRVLKGFVDKGLTRQKTTISKINLFKEKEER